MAFQDSPICPLVLDELGTFHLEKSNDDFAQQVFCHEDKRFWFRLERKADRERVTDFDLGDFPPETGGVILYNCFEFLDIFPRDVLEFVDIFGSHELSSISPMVQEAVLQDHDTWVADVYQTYDYKISKRDYLERGPKIDLVYYASQLVSHDNLGTMVSTQTKGRFLKPVPSNNGSQSALKAS